MGTISGKEYIDRINDLRNEVWLDGKKIEEKISDHPAFKGILKEKSSLYDLQKDPNLKDEMTFLLPGKEETIGLSIFTAKNERGLKEKKKNV